jgi:hypothetical protein
VNTGRVVLTGKTRTCPHCKATILESSSVCPACQHHLRFDSKAIVERRLQPAFSALRVEGGFKHPAGGEPWEYAVVVSIRNDRGEELARKVVGVGALAPNEGRQVMVSVDVFTATGPVVEVERRADTTQAPDKKAAPAPASGQRKELPEPQRSLQSMAQQTKDRLKPPK